MDWSWNISSVPTPIRQIYSNAPKPVQLVTMTESTCEGFSVGINPLVKAPWIVVLAHVSSL